MGLQLSEPERELLVEDLCSVLEANQRVNLTSIDDELEALRLHVIDSLTALPEVEAAPRGPMLDLGTGGGFPGIPLAIVSTRATTLLDSTTKKAREVEAIVAHLGLSSDVRVVAARAEEFRDHAERFSEARFIDRIEVNELMEMDLNDLPVERAMLVALARARSERMAKWNEGLRIEEALDGSAQFAGGRALRRARPR